MRDGPDLSGWETWPERHLVDPGLWVQSFRPAGLPAGRAALFLDRDGVIIEDTGYPSRPEDVLINDDIAATIAEANELAIPVVVVTNQSGVARGYFGWGDFAAVTAHIVRELAGRRASVDLMIACGYHGAGKPPLNVPDHPMRKPNPGMINHAAALLGLDAAGSVLLGDRKSDIEAARRAGLGGAWLVGGPVGETELEKGTGGGFSIGRYPSGRRLPVGEIMRLAR